MEGRALARLLVIDLIDEELGLAEVEDDLGRTYQLPSEWLPDAADGAAYRIELSGDHLTLIPDPAAAATLRERSKQTLLSWSDQPDEAPA